MKKQKCLFFINKIISFSILANLFLLPIIFDYFFISKNVFILPKTIFFYIFLLLLLVSTVVKIFLISKIKISQRFLSFLLIPLFLLLSLSISSLFSLDISLSWEGSYSRQNGLFFYFSLFLWVVLLSFNYYQDKKILNIRKFLITISLSSFFVSLYSIFQYLGFDWILWVEATKGRRVFSSLGQPNYLGVFINLIWPVVFYLFITEKKNILKILFFLIFIFNFLALIFSFSRGAWIGFAFGFIFLFLYYFFKIDRKKAFAGILFLIIISPFLLTQDFFVERINRFFDYKSGSGADRVVIWESALDKIKEKPILGYGLEQQEIVFRSTYNKEYALYENHSIFVDRSHNLILDYLLVGGLIYLILFSIFIFLLFRSIFYFFKGGKNDNNGVNLKEIKLEVFLGISIFSYLISLLFSFETIVDLIYFWTFSSIVLINYIKLKDNSYFIDNVFFKFRSSLKVFVFISLFLVFIISSLFFIKRLVADYNFSFFEKSFYNKDFDKGVEFYEKTISIYNKKEYYKKFIENVYVNSESINSNWYLDLLIYEASINLNNYYDDLITKAKAASFLNNFKNSEELINKAISEAPDNYIAYKVFAEICFENNKYELANIYYDMTIERLPRIIDENLVGSHKKSLGFLLGGIYEKKSIISSYHNDEELAIKYLKEAFKNSENILLLKKIADKYYNLNQIDEAIKYNKIGEMYDNNDPAWPTAIAWLYYFKNDFKMAKENNNRALLLDGSYDNALFLKKEIEKEFR